MLGNRSIAEVALGEDVGGAQAFALTAAVATFALTGVAAVFKINVPETVGTYALTGIADSFRVSMAEETGTYAEIGPATLFSINFGTAAGAYTLTGQDAVFAAGTLSAGVGAYVLTGQDISFFLDQRAITDTDILLLPVDCVLAGQQEKFTERYRTWEIPAYKRTEKGGGKRSGVVSMDKYGGRKGALRHAFNE